MNSLPRKGCKTSVLTRCLICAAGIYIGWSIFLFQTFDTIADLHAHHQGGLPGMLDNIHHGGSMSSKEKGMDEFLMQVDSQEKINHDEQKTAVANDTERKEGAPSIKNSKDDQYKVKEVKKSVIDIPVLPDEELASNDEFTARCLGDDNDESFKCVKLSDYTFDKNKAEKAIEAYYEENNQRIKPLRAYVEQRVQDEIPDTGRTPDYTNKKDEGVPNQFIEPYPLRTESIAAPDKLTKFEYPKVDSCQDLPVKLPTDAGLLYDKDGQFVYPNVHNRQKHIDVMEYAKYCPVDADPFLPWIHDVFPSNDGKMIHFIAQNKRRCNTGRGFKDMLHSLDPQVTLMQPVSVVRTDNEEATNITPELWIPDSDRKGKIDDDLGLPRYRLAPVEEADKGDGDFTRFICRFHTLEYDEKTKSVKEVIVGETLSTYPANYEYVNYRKRKSSMLTPSGKDNGLFWLSNLRFDCPVPENGNMQQSIASGDGVFNGTPHFYVDVIPIRTSTRYGFDNAIFTEEMVGPDFSNGKVATHVMTPPFGAKRTTLGFNFTKAFGENNIIPRVEASGRWENIPICAPHSPPPLKESNDSNAIALREETPEKKGKKMHTLSACLWASATFHTRGNDRMVTDTMDRMKEWLEYHLMIGFDHVYIFDNTGAHTNETNLKEVLSSFSDTEVTRIDWPSICCNNNKPGDENTGERSSQYAAESTCRQRYGQYTEWIANIDTDEYLVPMGKYNDMREVVDAATEEGTSVLSFRSTRAYPNFDLMEEFSNQGECGVEDNPLCLDKKKNVPYIEAYNCDFSPLPKPDWADRAKKQIYRPDYVLSHFVHYSTITKDILTTNAEANAKKERWNHSYFERQKSERFTNELEEAVMVHTKTTVPGNTKGYRRTCKFGFEETWKDKCRVGFPIPNNELDESASRPDGYKYNCYTNERLTNIFIPKLKEAMMERAQRAVIQ